MQELESRPFDLVAADRDAALRAIDAIAVQCAQRGLDLLSATGLDTHQQIHAQVYLQITTQQAETFKALLLHANVI